MSSVGADFRLLAPAVVAQCLHAAGTRVCEPIERFDVEVPATRVSEVLQLLNRSEGVVESMTDAGRYRRLEGMLPSARVGAVIRALPDLAAGEAVFTSRLERYRPVLQDPPPSRARIGTDPADRAAWFRAMPR
jgi:ribosomal protection tetracycline resistance protein